MHTDGHPASHPLLEVHDLRKALFSKQLFAALRRAIADHERSIPLDNSERITSNLQET